jgi:hypothetical protein
MEKTIRLNYGGQLFLIKVFGQEESSRFSYKNPWTITKIWKLNKDDNEKTCIDWEDYLEFKGPFSIDFIKHQISESRWSRARIERIV